VVSNHVILAKRHERLGAICAHCQRVNSFSTNYLDGYPSIIFASNSST